MKGRGSQEMREQIVITQNAQQALLVHRAQVTAKEPLDGGWRSVHHLNDLTGFNVADQRRFADGERISTATRNLKDPESMPLNFFREDCSGFHPVDHVGRVSRLKTHPSKFGADLLKRKDDPGHSGLELPPEDCNKDGAIDPTSQSVGLNWPYQAAPREAGA